MADEFNVDLTTYKDRVGQRVPPGRYRVVVDDAEVDKAASGNVMVNLWFRVVGSGEFDGAIIIDRLVQTERSMFRTVGFLQAIGMQTPKKKFKLNTKQIVGKSLQIDLEDGEPYMGRVRSEVRGYLRVEKGADTTGDLDLAVSDALTPEQQEEAMAVFAQQDSGDDTEVDLDKLDLG